MLLKVISQTIYQWISYMGSCRELCVKEVNLILPHLQNIIHEK
jgi:hypothetical protein